MGEPMELPHPDSAELSALVPNEETRLVYRLLYEAAMTGAEPPSMVEVREMVTSLLGRAHSQTDRRLRDLRRAFDIVLVRRRGRAPGYVLIGPKPDGSRVSRRRLSPRVEARVFAEWGARCADCGRTPKEDGIKLVLDHIVPAAWGGSDEEENLRPLCEFHNHGKQAWVDSLDAYAPAIRAALAHDDVRVRIGELLKALPGQQVPVEVINVVAREENRGDPTRRLRDLRQLGWEIEVKRRKEGKRTRSFYVLRHWEPWPAEGPAAVITRLEAQRRARR